jgi:hypothetical protein
MSHGDTAGEPGMLGIPVLPMGMGYTGTSITPARRTTGWTRRVCRVKALVLKRATGASDRVPRFSRLRWADSVRLVRFNIVLPSHPPD